MRIKSSALTARLREATTEYDKLRREWTLANIDSSLQSQIHQERQAIMRFRLTGNAPLQKALAETRLAKLAPQLGATAVLFDMAHLPTVPLIGLYGPTIVRSGRLVISDVGGDNLTRLTALAGNSEIILAKSYQSPADWDKELENPTVTDEFMVIDNIANLEDLNRRIIEDPANKYVR